MIEQYSIEVRDFMLLSLLCDQEAFDTDQLGRALGLSHTSTIECIRHLTDAGLIRYNGSGSTAAQGSGIRTTAAGRILARRILDEID